MPFIINGLMSCDKSDKLGEKICTLENCQIKMVYIARSKVKIKNQDIGNNGRYAIFYKDKEDFDNAQIITDSLENLMWFLEYGTASDFKKIRISRECIKGNIVDIKKVVDEQYLWGEDQSYVEHPIIDDIFSNCIGIPKEDRKWMFSVLPVIISKKELLDSLPFYKKSVEEYMPTDEDRTVYAYHKEKFPVSKIEQTNLENSFLNAYKAIEAIVGEPGKIEKKKKKFMKVLSNIGINSEECLRDIYLIQEIRDKKAGHGRKRSEKPVFYSEVILAQEVARVLIRTCLQKK